jgi:LytS/YehU family sensor histidine kinase
LENSFKHGVNRQINEGYVHAMMKVMDNKLLFRILNSKPNKSGGVSALHPFSQRGDSDKAVATTVLKHGAAKRNGGIGLVNVRRRLNLLYPNQYKLDIEDNDREHIVELSLDLTQ